MSLANQSVSNNLLLFLVFSNREARVHAVMRLVDLEAD